MSSNATLAAWLRRAALPAVTIGALTLAACGSDGGSGGSTAGRSASAGKGGTATTVTVQDVSGRAVLTTPDGATLYESDQEKGSVLCKSSACTDVWVPLTVTADQRPTAPDQVTGMLGTVKRPDGMLQVTLDNRPLYSFSFDHGAGKLTGDGFTDSFDGTHFTWHAATASGAPAPARSSATSGGGGYQYP